MSDEIRYGECPVHDTTCAIVSQAKADELGIEHGCPDHNREILARPDPATMTREERAEELDTFAGPMWSGLNVMKGRIDALVGRPVFTHEMSSSNWPYLLHEVRTGIVPSMDGVMAKFPHDKPVFGVSS